MCNTSRQRCKQPHKNGHKQMKALLHRKQRLGDWLGGGRGGCLAERHVGNATTLNVNIFGGCNDGVGKRIVDMTLTASMHMYVRAYVTRALGGAKQ